MNHLQYKAVDCIIEGAQSVLDNAPKTSTHYVMDTDTYHSVEFGSYFSHELDDWDDSDYRTEQELIEAYEIVLNLSKLKEQLADVRLIYSETARVPS